MIRSAGLDLVATPARGHRRRDAPMSRWAEAESVRKHRARAAELERQAHARADERRAGGEIPAARVSACRSTRRTPLAPTDFRSCLECDLPARQNES